MASDKFRFEQQMGMSAVSITRKAAQLTEEDFYGLEGLDISDETAYQLMRRYIDLIKISQFDFDYYRVRKTDFHTRLAKAMEEASDFKSWVVLRKELVLRSSERDSSEFALDILIEELDDTWVAFCRDTDEVVVGFSKDYRKALKMPSPFKWVLRKLLNECHVKLKKGMSLAEIALTQSKGGNRILAANEDPLLNICVIALSGFVTEKTLPCIDLKNWLPHHDAVVKFPRIYYDDPEAMHKAIQANFGKLPEGGLVCKLKNAGDITEVLLIEDPDRDVTIYKVTFGNRGCSLGMLGCSRPLIFSSFDAQNNNDNGMKTAIAVFEVYANYLTELDKSRKRKYAMLEVENLEDISLNSTNVYVKYEPLVGLDSTEVEDMLSNIEMSSFF